MADHHEITGALAVLREAMRASPIPSADILGFAVDCCSAAGFPPTTPELDEKLRALGLLFGKAAPGPADLTHFLWHVLDGSIPRPLLQQALEQALGREFKGLAGDKVRAVLEAVAARPTDIYGNDLIKNLGLILRSVAHRAIDMTTAGLEGSVAAERAERTAAMSTVRALEADLTKIARAYYGEEAPTGVAADGIAEFIRGAKADLVTISARMVATTPKCSAVDPAESARQAAHKEAHRVNLSELRALIGGHETADSAQVLRGAIDAITTLKAAVERQTSPAAVARAHAHMVDYLDIKQQAADMQRIKDLLHERRARLAMRDGEACTWPELVKGLLDDYKTGEANEQHLHRCAKEAGERAAAHAAKVAELEKQLAELRGKGPSAADDLRSSWEGDYTPGKPRFGEAALAGMRKAADVVSDVVWDGKAWVPRAKS